MSRHVAIIACALALPSEKGYSRFAYLANMLCHCGYDVDLYTSTFNHWEKLQRKKDNIKAIQKKVPYKIVLAKEPGYKKNVDPRRIISHLELSDNTIKALREKNSAKSYDLLYCDIPDNALAAKVAEFGHKNDIPVVVDIEDLWPEGMEQLLPVPKAIGKILFQPFRSYARKAYEKADAFIGTSDEFRDEPLKYGVDQNKPRLTVYVGCDLDVFDGGVKQYSSEIAKQNNEFWVIYTGTLGSSYDINTLIKAAQEIKRQGYEDIKFKILGGGPLKEEFENTASEKPCNVDFLGYVQYEKMAAYLSKSDVTVNSFVKSAPQSIVNKVGDYLAAGKPMINTLSSPEFRKKVEDDGFGLNILGEDVTALKKAIFRLYRDRKLCDEYGKKARRVAETQFDRKNSYKEIIKLINGMI